MSTWKDITAYADSLSQWFRIVYLLSPKQEDVHRVKVLLKSVHFDYPIFIDPHASIARQNPNLPKNKQLHSFLLDKNNRVVMVGNPLQNNTLWNLYKNTIQKMLDNGGVLPEK